MTTLMELIFAGINFSVFCGFSSKSRILVPAKIPKWKKPRKLIPAKIFDWEENNNGDEAET